MSGAEKVLFDTNVLVYAHDRNEPVKGAQAQNLLAQVLTAGVPRLSTQVLSEFYWTVTRKLRVPLTHDEAVAEVNRLAACADVIPVTLQVLERAFQAIAKHGMPLWDAQIFAVAVLQGVSFVLSEDFQHRQTIDGTTFLNPFAADFQLIDVLTP